MRCAPADTITHKPVKFSSHEETNKHLVEDAAPDGTLHSFQGAKDQINGLAAFLGPHKAVKRFQTLSINSRIAPDPSIMTFHIRLTKFYLVYLPVPPATQAPSSGLHLPSILITFPRQPIHYHPPA